VRALHAQRKLLAVMLDVLINRALDKLSLLEARHQRCVANLLLRGLMNLDRGLCAHYGSLGTSVLLRIPCGVPLRASQNLNWLELIVIS
jgi:hypothetical protein